MSNLVFSRGDTEFERFKDRNNSLNHTYTTENLKNNFERFAIELRKSHRYEHTAKRRALLGTTKYSAIFTQSYKGNINISEMPMSLIKSYPELASEEMPNIQKLIIICSILETEKATDIIVESLTTLLDVLGYADDMPIEPIFRLGFIPIFLKFSDFHYGTQIVYPAIACLANLTVCDNYFTTCLVNYGIIESMIRVITPKSLRISSFAIKALGNLIIDSKECFYRMINQGALKKICTLMEESKEIRKELYEALCFYISQVSVFYQELSIIDANRMLL